MKNIITILSTVIAVLLFVGHSVGQTVISGGDVNGVWTAASSPYQIEGDITVPAGETLELEAGVKVEFQGYYRFWINGKLQASGDKDNMIYFTVNDTTGFSVNYNSFGSWRGMLFQENGGELSVLDYCRIEFVKGTSALYLNDKSILISNSIITGNQNAEQYSIISFYLNASNDVFIFNNKICNNDGNAIRISGGGNENFVFDNNLISNNMYGFDASSLSSVHISNNTICNNLYYGLQLQSSVVDVYNCIIYGNRSGQQCNFDYNYNASSRYNFYNCDVQGIFPSAGKCIVTGTDIINSDPQFINPSAGAGFSTNYYDVDWRLDSCSLCINAGYPDTTGLGIPATDLAGKARIFDEIIDIGAYEYSVDDNGIEQQQGGQITVFPIPATDKINILFKDVTSKRSTVSIYTIFGQLIYSKTVTSINKYCVETIDLSHHSVGTYIVKIDYDDRTFTQKFLIKRL